MWQPVLGIHDIHGHGMHLQTHFNGTLASLAEKQQVSFKTLSWPMVMHHPLQVLIVGAPTCVPCYAVHRFDIAGWSTCPGALATWNLARQGGDSSPSTWLELEEGVTALAFHPTAPVGAAAGNRSASLLF